MTCLLFSDLHTDTAAATRLVELSRGADVVIGAGDFANMKHSISKRVDILRSIEKPTVLYPAITNHTKNSCVPVLVGKPRQCSTAAPSRFPACRFSASAAAFRSLRLVIGVGMFLKKMRAGCWLPARPARFLFRTRRPGVRSIEHHQGKASAARRCARQ
jgi:hypothetical protein